MNDDGPSWLGLLVAALAAAWLLLTAPGCTCRQQHLSGWDIWRRADGELVAREPRLERCGTTQHRLEAPTHALVVREDAVAVVDLRQAARWTDEGCGRR